MSGTVTVTRTGDWLTPYAVEVAIEGMKPSTSRFAAQARTQQYAQSIADQHGLDVVYDLDVSPLPTNAGARKTSRERAEEFPRRHHQICQKCRVSKPLAEFRVLTRRNVTNGVMTHNGWAEKCLACEEREETAR